MSPIGVVDRFEVRGRTLDVSSWAAGRGAAAVVAPTHAITSVEVLVSGAPAAHLEVDTGLVP